MRSPLQFAVMREDPRLEERLLDRLGPSPKRYFGITAAGDTHLQLATRRDLTDLVGTDIDARQTAWARFKMEASRHLSRRDFCRALGISQIDSATREGLINRVAQGLTTDERAFFKAERAFFAGGAFDDGTFERLFACLRGFLERFVAPADAIERMFLGDSSVRDMILTSDQWPIAFELFFHQSVLLALFGPDAVQHAPPSSYPRYFRPASNGR